MTETKNLYVFPGRGTYTKESLGYLKRALESKHPRQEWLKTFVSQIDRYRESLGYPTITELDEMKSFDVKTHTAGIHAAPLIYTCALVDFYLNEEKYPVAAITGNSMGWYLALAAAGALSPEAAIELVQKMALLTSGDAGGQVIYPLVDEKWHMDPEKQEAVNAQVKAIREAEGEVYPSIYLGGYLVLGADRSSVSKLLKALPPVDDRFPFKLVNHSAFHTPLMKPASDQAIQEIPQFFQKPRYPLIDGRGHIWQPYATDLDELRSYTLGHQVFEPYDFSGALRTGLREFAPDHIILTGPGDSLGAPIGHILIEQRWPVGPKHPKVFFEDKASFSKYQKEQEPYLMALGRQ